MAEERSNDLAASLAMVLLRSAHGVEQRWLARTIQAAPDAISDFEHGKRPVPREVLERTARATGFPAPLLDTLLRGLRSFLVAKRGRARADRGIAEGVAAEILALAREGADLALAPRRRSLPRASDPRPEDRAEAAALLACLRERSTPARARLLVEEAKEYRTWVVAEQAALLSVDRAPNRPREAREWAGLAVDVARLPSDN